jgi:hypothetical protein
MSVKKLLIALMFTFLTSTTQAQDAVVNLWQGEWKSSDGTYGLSVRDCDTNNNCNVNVFKIDKAAQLGSAISCLNTGSVTILPNSKLQNAKLNGYQNKVCNFSLLQVDSQKELSFNVQPSDGSLRMCDCDGIFENRTFFLQSSKNYPASYSDAGTCLNDQRKSAQTWCTDNDLQTIEENMRHITHVNVWPAHIFWLKDSLSVCNDSTDIKSCLIERYKNLLDQLKSESSNLGQIINGPIGSPEEARAAIQKLEGVYKNRFQNSDIDGNKYQSENVFEFVHVSDVAAYIKVHLQFFNGHSCSISGIAEYKQSGELIFQDPDIENSCALSISQNKEQIKFEDRGGNCHKFCGARGGLGGVVFNLNQKRKIRYMPTILKSNDYQTAISSYQAQQSQVKK